MITNVIVVVAVVVVTIIIVTITIKMLRSYSHSCPRRIIADQSAAPYAMWPYCPTPIQGQGNFGGE